jgi:dimethylamine/trimethylamine dehydrogenase
LTPDDIMAGQTPPPGPVLLFDDDDYYMGGVLAEQLCRQGRSVTLVTPAALVSAWTVFTLEQEKIQTRLLELGVEILANTNLTRIGAGEVELACVFTDKRRRRETSAVVMVTSRLPNERLYHELSADQARLSAAGIESLSRIGDCHAPGMVAHAVYAGHRFAREFGEPAGDFVSFKQEPIDLDTTPA